MERMFVLFELEGKATISCLEFCVKPNTNSAFFLRFCALQNLKWLRLQTLPRPDGTGSAAAGPRIVTVRGCASHLNLSMAENCPLDFNAMFRHVNRSIFVTL